MKKSDNNVRLTKKEKAYSIIMSQYVLLITCKGVFKRCNSSTRCLCCKVLRPCETFVCHVTGKTFVVDCECLLGCKSKYINYLLTCSDCGLQYVGKTSQCLHRRLNGHRSA